MKFKVGDYVYYMHRDGGTIPTKIYNIVKKRILVANWRTEVDEYGHLPSAAIWVKPENCILQSEWEKQHH